METDLVASARAAMMADLSRSRLDQFELTDCPKRGPTYNPQGNNSVDHIPQAQRDRLMAEWSVPIDDAETRAMEGLQLGDGRLYDRRGPRQRPQTQHQILGTIPAEQQRKQIHSPQSMRSVAQTLPNHKEKPVESSTPVETLIPVDVEISTKDKFYPPYAEPCVALMKQDPSRGPCYIRVTAVPAGSQTPREYTTMDGVCKVLRANKAEFRAWFQLVLRDDGNAFFALGAPQKPARLHDVQDLELPVVEGAQCKLVHIWQGKVSQYKFDFGTVEAAEVFKAQFEFVFELWIEETQSAPTATSDQNSTGLVEKPLPHVIARHDLESQRDGEHSPSSSQSSQTMSTDSVTQGTSQLTVGDAVKVSMTSRPGTDVTATCDVSKVGSLINLEDSQSKTECLQNMRDVAEEYTQEAAEAVCSLFAEMLAASNIHSHYTRILTPEHVMRWATHGTAQTLPAQAQRLADTLQLLASAQRAGNDLHYVSSPATWELLKANVNVSSRRIQYMAEQLEQFRQNASVCPDKFHYVPSTKRRFFGDTRAIAGGPLSTG